MYISFWKYFLLKITNTVNYIYMRIINLIILHIYLIDTFFFYTSFLFSILTFTRWLLKSKMDILLLFVTYLASMYILNPRWTHILSRIQKCPRDFIIIIIIVVNIRLCRTFDRASYFLLAAFDRDKRSKEKIIKFLYKKINEQINVD